MTVGQEYVFRIYKTPTQYGVKRYDGRGLADGFFSMPERRYFKTEKKAIQWCKNRSEKMECETRIVHLGETI